MPWLFEIKEVSAGCYKATAFGDFGRSISKEGFESIIGELIADVYKTEVKLGTAPCEAIYKVTLDFLSTRYWDAQFHEGMAGSWRISSKNSQREIHYDGRDQYLIVVGDEGAYIWQGSLNQLDRVCCQYFQKLLYI